MKWFFSGIEQFNQQLIWIEIYSLIKWIHSNISTPACFLNQTRQVVLELAVNQLYSCEAAGNWNRSICLILMNMFSYVLKNYLFLW